jgi:hypothetical protein
MQIEPELMPTSDRYLLGCVKRLDAMPRAVVFIPLEFG